VRDLPHSFPSLSALACLLPFLLIFLLVFSSIFHSYFAHISLIFYSPLAHVWAAGTWEVQMNCCDYLTDEFLTVKGETNSFNYTNVSSQHKQPPVCL